MYDLNKIDEYILGKLPPREKNSFEQTLASDPSLLAKVNERKELILVTQLASASDRKKELKQLYKEVEMEGDNSTSKKEQPAETSTQNSRPKKGMIVRLMPYLAIAACLTALCYFLIFNISTDLNPLVKEYYSPYSVTVRSNDNTTVKEKAYKLYTDKEYKNALPLLDQLAPDNEEARLLKGIALLETGSAKDALKTFDGLTNSLLFADHAKWYAALALLQLNQETKARELLQVLSNQTEYTDKAKQLLGKM